MNPRNVNLCASCTENTWWYHCCTLTKKIFNFPPRDEKYFSDESLDAVNLSSRENKKFSMLQLRNIFTRLTWMNSQSRWRILLFVSRSIIREMFRLRLAINFDGIPQWMKIVRWLFTEDNKAVKPFLLMKTLNRFHAFMAEIGSSLYNLRNKRSNEKSWALTKHIHDRFVSVLLHIWCHRFNNLWWLP